MESPDAKPVDVKAVDNTRSLRETRRADILVTKGYAASPALEWACLLLNRSLVVILYYRLSAYFFRRWTWWGRAIAKIFWRLNILQCACDFDRQSVIGPGLILNEDFRNYALIMGQSSN